MDHLGRQFDRRSRGDLGEQFETGRTVEGHGEVAGSGLSVGADQQRPHRRVAPGITKEIAGGTKHRGRVAIERHPQDQGTFLAHERAGRGKAQAQDPAGFGGFIEDGGINRSAGVVSRVAVGEPESASGG
jgi:hypothetical protein